MRATLLKAQIAAAVVLAPAGSQLQLNDAARSLCAEAQFTYGSGGATVDAYLQTSLDGGLSWIDIAEFHFTGTTASSVCNLSSLTPVTAMYTPTNGSLAANTVKDGILGPIFQVQLVTTGTYVGSSLRIDVTAQER